MADVEYKDLFTRKEVEAAKGIVRGGGGADEIMATIVTPSVMARIDKRTGQTNDREYMAYRLMYVAGQP